MSNPVIDEHGTAVWRNNNGGRHREDGPAVIYNNGTPEWCLNGYPYTFDNWADALGLDTEQRTLLRLAYA